MKKVISWILLVGIVSLTNFSLAQDKKITQYFDGLGGGDLFWYSNENQIIVKSISEKGILFSSPIIKNENNENISQYNLLFSENLLSDVISNPDLIDTLNEKKIINTGSWNFDFSINVKEDKINIDKIYYISVAPKDNSWIIGAVSDEFCFNIKNKIYTKIDWDKDACSKKIAEKKIKEEKTVHNAAAGADMNFAHISSTIDGESIVLTWISQRGSDKVEIFLLNEKKSKDWEPVWEKQWVADMMDGEFKFPYQWPHSTRVLLKPNNDGTEVEHTINATPPVKKEEPKPTKKPTISVIPNTGTKENLLVIFIISLLGFVLYKAMRKSK